MTAMRLLILPGDGIGPEVMTEVGKVIDWFSRTRDLRFETNTEIDGDRIIGDHSSDRCDLPPYEGPALPVRGNVRC